MKYLNIKKALINLLSVLLLGLGFSGCGKDNKALKIGATAGPQVEIMEFVRDLAKEEGSLNIKIIEFNDYILPNAALDTGDLDANAYQHIPFLEDQIKSRGYELTAIAKTILLPMGIYSSRHDSLDKLKEGMKIGIPNDPTNGGRALLLLEKAGIITLKPGTGYTPTLLDVVDNLQEVKILELEAPQLPLTLADVDYAVINTDWILVSGRDPESAIYREESDSPYSNVIVIRTQDAEDPRFEELIELYQSDKTKSFIKERFGNAIVPAWE